MFNTTVCEMYCYYLPTIGKDAKLREANWPKVVLLGVLKEPGFHYSSFHLGVDITWAVRSGGS